MKPCPLPCLAPAGPLGLTSHQIPNIKKPPEFQYAHLCSWWSEWAGYRGDWLQPCTHLGLGSSNLGLPPAHGHEVMGIITSSLCTFGPPPQSPEGTGVDPKKACLPEPRAYRPNLLPRSKWVQMVGGHYRAEF